MKKYKVFSVILLVGIFFTACIDDDEGSNEPDFPELNRGTIEANRVIITFYPSGNTNDRQSFEFYDADGVGGNAPTINDTIRLKFASSSQFLSYESEIEFFVDNQNVTNDIINLGTKYNVCYRDFDDRNLRLTSRDNDSNGVPLGIKAQWSTVKPNGVNSATGNVRITLNFQNASKEASCDAGIRIFEANMNYLIN